jgi:hypothetical protein
MKTFEQLEKSTIQTKILVIPTNEEIEIEQAVFELLTNVESVQLIIHQKKHNFLCRSIKYLQELRNSPN